MRYFRLHRKDGSFEIICTRCRLVVGAGEESARSAYGALEIESLHRCPALDRPLPPARRSPRKRALLRWREPVVLIEDAGIPKLHAGTNIPFAFLSVASFIYAVPTSLEFLANQFCNPWLAAILLGDLIGCVWLAVIFKMRKTGLVLYLLLAVCKCCLCLLEAVPASTLFWITDLVPAVVIAGRIAWGNAHLAESDVQS